MESTVQKPLPLSTLVLINNKNYPSLMKFSPYSISNFHCIFSKFSYSFNQISYHLQQFIFSLANQHFQPTILNSIFFKLVFALYIAFYQMIIIIISTITSSSNKLKMTKQTKWTQEEEQYLKLLKQEKKIENWKIIANELANRFPDHRKRSKQCRQRYMNYTRFGQTSISSLDWSNDEEYVIYENYLTNGSSWKKLSQQIKNRSENCIKNKFYSGIRKFIRKFNSFPAQTYSLKFDGIKRMFKATDPTNQKTYGCYKQFRQLREIILKFSQISACNAEIQDIQNIKNKFIEFNKKMRYLCLKKNSTKSSQKKISHIDSNKESIRLKEHAIQQSKQKQQENSYNIKNMNEKDIQQYKREQRVELQMEIKPQVQQEIQNYQNHNFYQQHQGHLFNHLVPNIQQPILVPPQPIFTQHPTFYYPFANQLMPTQNNLFYPSGYFYYQNNM